MNIKEVLKSYQETNGGHPLSAAFNLITFAKAIPWHLGKAILVALLLYFILTFLMVKMGFSYVFLFFGFVVGFIWAVIVGLAAGVKFITSSLIDNFTNLLTGVVEPVDKVYDNWKEETDEKMDRTSFFKEVTREVIVPEFTKFLRFLPFKGRIENYLQEFLDRVFGKANEKEEKIGIEANEKVEKEKRSKKEPPVFKSRIVQSIEEGSEHIQAKISTPFYTTLKWGLLLWGGIFLLGWLLQIK